METIGRGPGSAGGPRAIDDDDRANGGAVR